MYMYVYILNCICGLLCSYRNKSKISRVLLANWGWRFQYSLMRGLRASEINLTLTNVDFYIRVDKFLFQQNIHLKLIQQWLAWFPLLRRKYIYFETLKINPLPLRTPKWGEMRALSSIPLDFIIVKIFFSIQVARKKKFTFKNKA